MYWWMIGILLAPLLVAFMALLFELTSALAALLLPNHGESLLEYEREVPIEEPAESLAEAGLKSEKGPEKQQPSRKRTSAGKRKERVLAS